MFQKKTVTCYGNNKAWVTKELKETLNMKKKALAANNKPELKRLQTVLKKDIAAAKDAYSKKIKRQFSSNDAKQAWAGLRDVAGYTKKSVTLECDNNVAKANELNEFYARFDNEDSSAECDQLVQELLDKNDPDVEIEEEEILLWLSRTNTRKSAGPDNISGKLLKICKYQLTPVLHKLFNTSLKQHTVPVQWKTSTIVPLAKNNLPKVNNDLRPVALTVLIMKCFERIFLQHLKPQTAAFNDPLQFAYLGGRCVEDAVLTLLHHVTQHVDKAHTYARLLFVDFSSAFNTIKPHVLMKKLMNMNINSNMILWIHSFLTNRRQHVRFNSVFSSDIVTNTGAPQGCVLSPVLFTLYTSDCRSSHQSCQIIKYADDTVLVGCISNDVECDYFEEINYFTTWCKDNFLTLNVTKTKEMLIDFRIKKSPLVPVKIDNESVEVVDKYKYLGVIIDDQLSMKANVEQVTCKSRKRLYFLRKLNEFNIDKTLIRLFYDSVIYSVLTFCLVSWYGMSTDKTKNEIVKIDKRASYIIKDNVKCNFDEEFEKLVKQKTVKIMKDVSHPLHSYFYFLKSGVRLSAIICRTSRFQNTFVPTAVSMFNRLRASR
jgi:hypothetical protein